MRYGTMVLKVFMFLYVTETDGIA